jgi:sec-independent protein translocase protein TatC
MEKQTENGDKKPRKSKRSADGTMSFIDHLDELRSRLIRYLIVLTLIVLVCYFYRKEILDAVRSPVDIPLKKYTAQSAERTTKSTKKSWQGLNAYNCECQEIRPTLPVPVAEEKATQTETPAEQTSVETDKSPEELIGQVKSFFTKERAQTWLIAGKGAVNDFLMFFQAILGKEPSPIFETDQQDSAAQLDSQDASLPPMAGEINLSCNCILKSDQSTRASNQAAMVYIGLPELFFAQMKVAIFAGIFISFPYLLIELWGFVGPALYRGERKVYWIFALSSYIFFIGGALFGYFVVFPYGFDFFLSLTQLGEIMPSLSIGQYLSFALKLLIAFGLIFELPLATFILARLGIVTPELMIKQSRMAILVMFVAAAMLTPPDPFTMMLMAGPLILLYLFSIVVCFLGVNRQKAALRAQGLDTEDM